MGQDDSVNQPDQIAELQAKLDAARAAKEAAETKRQDRWRAKDLEREIEREMREAEEAAVLEELEAEHGRDGEKIWRLKTGIGMVVVKCPTPAKYRAFVDKGKTSQNAQETFVREFLLYPDKTKFNAMVTAMPALIARCTDALIHLAGWREREEVSGKSTTS